MKFLLICWGDPFTTQAGTEIYIGNLAAELAVHGHDIHLLYGGKIRKGDLYTPTKHLFTHPFHLINIPYIRALDFRRKCANLGIELINEFRIDVVIASGAGTFPGYIFDKIKKLKSTSLLVYYAMDSMVMEYARSKMSKENAGLGVRFKKWVYYTVLIKSDKTSCIQSDLILASSKDTINHLAADYSVPLAKINLLYEGIPEDFAVGQEISDPEISTFLHISGGPRKGTDYFLKALKLLEHKYGKKAKAVITRVSQSTVKQAEALGVEVDAYRYLNMLELKRQYASCTAFVSPSLSEGFCLPIIEAAMFEKPSVVTNIGSLPELVTDGETGFVVPVADVNTLADRLYQIITNVELRRKMGKNARKRAEDFTIATTISNLLTIVKEFKR
ncbi:MAG: glycosyltransferase family 4 protein [Candidatus Bathyarchaeia archaeon]